MSNSIAEIPIAPIEAQHSSGLALITGGSSGIGLAMAHELAQKALPILIVSNQKERLTELEEEWQELYKCRLYTLFMDLAAQDAPDRLYQYCNDQNWKVDVLINNAGMYFFGQAADASKELASKMLLLHIHCMSLLCTLFGKDMRERRTGHILNISSISAFKDFPGIAYYGSSKGYIRSFSRSLQMELKPYGVGVTCTCPGATHTNLYGGQKIPFKKLKRIGIMMDPESVAKISLNAMFAHKPMVVPGCFNKMIWLLMPIIPYRLIYWVRRYSNWLN